jgi:CPA2 family monovalent cation:H+ antiporter-2
MSHPRGEIIRKKLDQVANMDSAKKKGCVHFDQIVEVTPDAVDVCPQCVELGDTWVNLRLCMICGQVGCCDDSINTHARKHSQESGHPVIMSHMPNEDWLWCYPDEVLIF